LKLACQDSNVQTVVSVAFSNRNLVAKAKTFHVKFKIIHHFLYNNANKIAFSFVVKFSISLLNVSIVISFSIHKNQVVILIA